MLVKSLFLVLPLAIAHSWVERVRRLGLNRTMIGDPGFIRGAMFRLDPVFNDLKQQYLLPPPGRDASLGILPSDPICRDSQQTVGQFNASLPPLQASPGDFIALQYQENGHITLPENTPHKLRNSTVFIYGTCCGRVCTSSPSKDDRLLSTHRVWNACGTGGDQRGVLLATRSFDDGQCYQINNGSISSARQKIYSKVLMNPQGVDIWCQNDLRLPTDIHDNYTLYWVWEWPTIPTGMVPQGRMEVYTTCMDIQIQPGIPNGIVIFEKNQDLNFAGIEEQMLAN
ncbi:uncharacterized protein BCR38DRAFT_501857 [Pseudomassariella vexata]|uniref:DUF7492 domain-containing protein n=1 Tax=Pseudomassariella vexata TaxID=1141098 RepID=A0A1Y2DFL9_9PEZI|nr:uncharacterized protein BCR38DRAFT_501857 [Pseudomassariella vexata]ORY57485.1 hypothetical protein BCR38DRAFT_501857 [Pseudomassariella vexata]